MKKGFDILRDKTLYKSIAFTKAERERLGLRGLLPHRVSTQKQLVDRVMTSLRRLPRDIDRYMSLSSLQERNEHLFYRTVIDHIEEIMPLIYTPTVGEACREFSHIAREPKGLFITPDDRGQIKRLLGNWNEPDIRSSSSPTESASSAWAISARTGWGYRSENSRSIPRAPGSPATLPSRDPRRRHRQRRVPARPAVFGLSAPARRKAARTSRSSTSSSRPSRRDTPTR